MIGRRWCSINRSVSGKLNWQLVANKQRYEYGLDVPISGGVQPTDRSVEYQQRYEYEWTADLLKVLSSRASSKKDDDG